jgi:hypothetical protein
MLLRGEPRRAQEPGEKSPRCRAGITGNTVGLLR